MKTIIAAFRDQTAADQAIEFLHSRGLDDIELMNSAGERGSFDHLRDDLHVPDDRARLYADVIDHGSPVIAAHTDLDAQAEEIAMKLDQMGSLDLEEQTFAGDRAVSYEAATEGLASSGTGERASETELQGRTGGEAEVIEERAVIGKREVPRGGVRVRTYVAERPVTEQVQLEEERITVEREPVNEPISPSAVDAALAEEEFEVTARGEEAVVGKEARIVERVHVAKTTETRTENVEATERRQEVEVEQIGDTEKRGDRDPRR